MLSGITQQTGRVTDASVEANASQTQQGSWIGRSIRQIVPSSTDESTAKGGGGATVSCCCLGALLLITGGICYGVGNSSCQDPERSCNADLRDAGKYTMIAGGALLGLSACCITALCCCASAAIGIAALLPDR